jgi:hypothetical protein
MRYISGYNQPQTWLSYIGDWITLVAAVSACSFTFSVFLGWLIQVVPDINSLKSRSNGLEALVNTTGGPLYFLPNGDPVIGCGSIGFPQDLCTFTSEAISNITQLQVLIGGNSTFNSTFIPTTNVYEFAQNLNQGQINAQQLLLNAQLTARKSYNMYISATYGNDGTCDATVRLPCATTARTMQLVPNTTNQFAQYNFVYDSGVYTESNPIAIKPNILFSGNEAATYLIFSAGVSFDGGAWQATGTGFVSFQRWALIRCTAACNFDMNAAAPATSIFSVVSFYNSTIENLSSVMFRRRADANSFFKVHFESTVMTLNTATFTDMTLVEWTQSGDIYTNLNINYNTTTTYLAGAPLITVEGLVSHGAIAINNNVPMSVDATFTSFVQKDSATLTATAIAGATIATHADVTSYGVINNGLIPSGAGSITLQYLTQAYGLGYVPYNATNWATTGVPTNVKQMGDYLDYRVRQLELNTFSNSSIVALSARVAALEATTTRNLYISATFGNDATCDGSCQYPCLTLYRTMQLVPNTTNQFSQYTLVFDNGLYAESNFIAFKPNIVLSGNEIGTFLVLGAGAGLDGGAWAATTTGYVSVLRFGLFRCDAACNFDMAAAVPSASIFSVFRFYNTSIGLNAPMQFKRRSDTGSYFAVTMESTTVNSNTVTFQEMTAVTWSISGDTYAALIFNYNSTSTYSSGTPVITINGLLTYAANQVNNYATGVTVDFTAINYVHKGGATMTINKISGASVNTHGDILAYGSINNGFTTTGAGSGSVQYLTQTYGLGYTPANSSYWNSPVPDNQYKANEQFIIRIKNLEANVPQHYVDTQFSENGSPATTPLTLTLGTGNEYIVGPSCFTRTGSGLQYTCANTVGFHFQGFFELVFNSGGSLTGVTVFVTLYKGVSAYPVCETIFGGSGTYTNSPFGIYMDTFIFLATGDLLTLEIAFPGGGSTAYINNGFTNYFMLTSIVTM